VQSEQAGWSRGSEGGEEKVEGSRAGLGWTGREERGFWPKGEEERFPF
jgi:hypothetical protein